MNQKIIIIEHKNGITGKKILIENDYNYDSYLRVIDNDNSRIKVMDFTQNELNNEKWRNIAEWMPSEYKQYMEKDSRNLELYNCKKYYISNLGRLSYENNNDLILMSVINYKNRYTLITLNNKSYTVHRLVAYIFIPNDNIKYKKIINHKGIHQKYNNRASFLEWCNENHNSNNDILKNNKPQTKSKDCVKIKCINLNDNSIILFDSLYAVAQKFNCSSNLISYYCMNNKIFIFNNIKYKFEYENNVQGRKTYPWEPVVQLNNDDNSFIKLYITLKELKDENIDKPSHILDTCRKNRKINDYMFGCKMYKWMYLRDYNKLIDIPINLPFTDKFVSISGNNRLIKIYDSIYDFIDLNYDLNIILDWCNNPNKSLNTKKYMTTTLPNRQKTYRKWIFLKDYLKYLNINKIEDILLEYIYDGYIAENDIIKE